MKKTNSKRLKAIGFSSLALLMGIAGTLAFAPLGASQSNIAGASANNGETATTSGLGLDPKNDPVVYTTESGLQIKMSNVTKFSGTNTTTTNTGYTYTQDLSSFYYFTMGTYSGTIYTAKNKTDAYTVNNEPVNWIILGLGPNTGYFLDEVASNLFSTWKTNTENVNNAYNNKVIGGTYFFKEIFESTTPAGSAINSVVPSKSYVIEKVKASIPVNPGNRNEIPEGCMLVLSEKLLGRMYFNGTGALNANHWTTWAECYSIFGQYSLGTRYRYIGNNTSSSSAGSESWTTSGNSGGSLYNYINDLFSKDTSGTVVKNGLGFTQTQANLIVPQQLYTYYSNGSGYNYAETPSTDGGTYYTMFPLAYSAANSATKQNFCIEDYLTSNTQRIASFIGSPINQSYYYWLRSGASVSNLSEMVWQVQWSGAISNSTHHVNNSHGVRPAMVMKLK